MTIGEAIIDAKGWLESHEVGSARLDAELLLGHVLNHDRAWLLAHSDDDFAATVTAAAAASRAVATS